MLLVPKNIIMFLSFVRRNRRMILASIFFFYMGCSISLSLLRLECAEASTKRSSLVQTIDDVEYTVLILSGPDNNVKRDTIRATWMQLANNIFIENGEKLYKWKHIPTGKHLVPEFTKFYFVVGKQGLSEMKKFQLHEENKKNNDLLLLNELEDSYKNLSLKMLQTLKWVNDHLKGLKYLIKCDDDTFLRVDLIIKNLEAFAPEMNAKHISKYVTYKKDLASYKGLYWGYFNGHANVYLNGKWQEKEWFLCDYYLPYALGGGYIISESIVKYIGANVDILSPYNSEDVSMGVWTAALANINRVHDIRFDTEWKSRGCTNDMLVRHKQTPEDMLALYNTLVNTQGETLCKTETSILSSFFFWRRKSYLYKWDVLPSTCCR